MRAPRLIVSFIGSCLVLAAQPQPRITNAKLEPKAASPNLQAAFKSLVQAQSDPAWIGWAVPIVPGERNSCCYSSGSGFSSWGCGLEGGMVSFARDTSTPVQLEGPTHLMIFARVSGRAVDKLRTFTPECPIDGGGLPFYWFSDVRPADSVALLAGMIESTQERRYDGVISAIALHRDNSADSVLDKLITADQPENVRRSAAFWLGNARGKHGYDILVKLLTDDPSERVREHSITALGQSKETNAIPAVVKAARDDKSSRVRGHALTWLAQRASRQISEQAILDAIDKDPDTEVKRRAVSALQQMPKGEGIPILIEIAKNNRNAAVRKQAMTMLGQSRDPRAVKFFEDVLSR